MIKFVTAVSFALLLPFTTHAQGIPGLRGPDHFGLTVPDQQEALIFFTEVIGCKAYYTIGPFKFDNEWMKDNLNVDPRTELRKATMLRCAYGTNIELLDYRPPERNALQPRNSDVGGHHVGFLVDDINSAVAYLKSKGVQVLGEPKTVTRGPTAGKTWVYFLAPWGTQLELAQYPNGLAYERDIEGAALWNPAKPAE